MKRLIYAFLVALLPTLALALGDVTVAWDANPPAEQVTHYRVYYSTTQGNYTGAAFVEVTSPTTLATIPNLADGTWYLVATARNAVAESGYSNELTTVIDTTANVPPSAPGILRIVEINYHQ